MKKILSLFLIGLTLLINSQVLACQSYVYRTTTHESYNASSPIGHFSSHNKKPIKYNKDNIAYSYASDKQDIYTPQNYDRSVTHTEEIIDTREPIDKNIERGTKIIGGLAIAGLVTGLVIAMTRD